MHPDITTAFGCCELEGITPGWMANRSVKLRPFNGTVVIFAAEMVSPTCELVVSIPGTSTVTLSTSACIASCN